MNDVIVGDGKYKICHDERGHLTAYRYGEHWRDLVGDNLVITLCHEINYLKEQVEALTNKLMEKKQ